MLHPLASDWFMLAKTRNPTISSKAKSLNIRCLIHTSSMRLLAANIILDAEAVK